MSDSPKQSPLGVNSLGSVLQNRGLNINPTAQGFMGISKSYVPNGGSYNLGSICRDTVLRMLTYSINTGYKNTNLNETVYNNLINIGNNSIPALGNSKPPQYYWDVNKTLPDPDANIPPVGRWTVNSAWAPTGWGSDNQYVDSTGSAKLPISAWGFIRLIALQAWGEFNYNDSQPEYKDFLHSFMAAYSFIEQSNIAILSVDNSKEFLRGTYSNMNDLTTADIAGVSLATLAFGNDLIALGKALDLRYIEAFGLPSKLLLTLKENNAITTALNLAMLSSGLTIDEIESFVENNEQPTPDQEKSLYGAFSVLLGDDLLDILIPLNCNTPGLETLADLLDPKKLFPNSYRTLTVPIYNTEPGPTNSKTYYPIYSNNGTNQTISSPAIASQVGAQIPSGSPQPAVPTTPIAEIPVVQNGPGILTTVEEAATASGERGSAYPSTIAAGKLLKIDDYRELF